MANPLKYVFLWLCLVGGLVAIPQSAIAEAPFELGLAVELLLPTHMPEFEVSIPAFGPNVSIPIGNDHLRIQGLFAGQNGITFYLAETGYYYTVTTPFFQGFIGLGAHFMHYETIDGSYNFVGGNGGIGLSIPMSKSFIVMVEMKGYLQQKPLVTFGGGFSFVL